DRVARGRRALAVVVEGRVDLGDLLGLDVTPARVTALLDGGLTTEVDPERIEVEPVAATGIDLLERREQLLLGRGSHIRPGGNLVGRPDVDAAVLLQTGGRRDPRPDDAVS